MYLGLPRFQFALAEVRGSPGSRDILVSSSLASDPSEIKTINPWRSYTEKGVILNSTLIFWWKLANFKFDAFEYNRLYFADNYLMIRKKIFENRLRFWYPASSSLASDLFYKLKWSNLWLGWSITNFRWNWWWILLSTL